MAFRAAACAVVLLCGAVAARGQSTAEIAGTVSDSSGAVIPAASVRLTNTATGVSRTAETNDRGYWAIPLLQPGDYRVDVRREGFKPAARKGIQLHIAQQTVADVVLEVGATSDEVTVTAGAPLLQTMNATQGQVIDNRRIVDLPLNGRDYIQLALLSAGALAPARGAEFGGFSAGGMRADQNNFLLDGMDNNSLQRTGQGQQAEAVKPSVDSIEEFKLMTNGFSAEFGRAAGGVVNVSMKSGTNQLHGTVYEFLRNNRLDAKNFFDSPAAKRPPFKRNQYGFSVGGPIIRNRTFFFGDYEGSRIRESRTINATIPTVKQTQGDFSERLPGTLIHDPATYTAAAGNRNPFPGNVIPAARFDRVGAILAKLYPAPNKPGLTNNYLSNPRDSEDVNRWDVKIDHVLSSKHNLNGRYSSQNRDIPVAPPLPPPAWGAGTTTSNYAHQGQNFMVGYNRVLTNAFVWEIKAGWNRLDTARTAPDNVNYNATLLNLPGVDRSAPGMAQFAMTGFYALGIGNFNPNLVDTQNRQIVSNWNLVKGGHTLKWGVNVRWEKHSLTNSQQAHGQFSFNAAATRNVRTSTQGSSIADLLLGHPNSAQSSNHIWEDTRRPSYELFMQDEWRATRKLTLSLGVRYELHMPWVDRLNKIANTDISDFVNPTTVSAKDGSRRDRGLVNTDWNNVNPRIGIAYKANEKTVIRTGYGVFIGNTIWKPLLMQNPPFHFKAALTSNPTIPELQLANGMPEGILGFASAQDILIETQDTNFPMPYSQQWNFAVQRETPWDGVLEVGYYANQTIKLTQQYDINQPPPMAGNLNANRLQKRVFVPGANKFITIGQNRYTAASANANFHSLQAKYEKRFSSGFTLLTTYIWSKTINDARGGGASGGVSNANPQDVRNLRSERSVADEHVPHRFINSYVYELPLGKGRRYMTGLNPVANAVLGGWSTAGIISLAAGPPVHLSVQGNPSNSGSADRPNVVGQWKLDAGERSLSRWFNTAAFVPNGRFAFGNAGRNLLQSPGMVNLDLAVYKTFAIKERVKLQFRAEAFNSTNTPLFDAPNAQVGNPNFGMISSAGRPRNLQFGLKVIF